MKKNIFTVLFLIMIIFSVSGCNKKIFSNNEQEITKREDIEYVWQKIIKSEDSFSNCGFTHFVADETCMYTFETYGNNDLTWDVYILDKEWDDADRYIPQANELTFQTEGRLKINEGQYVYIQCPHNDFTSDTPLKGDYLKIFK